MRVPVPALLSMLVLSGCALPPIVTVASLAANGVSYATTGKGTADHAISAFAGEDCAMLRAAKEEEICDPNGEVLVALEGASTADQNWYADPETGSPAAIAAPQPVAPGDQMAARDPAPRTTALSAPASDDGREKSLDALVDLVAKPPVRGRFADARPASKPDAPLVQEARVASAPEPEPQAEAEAEAQAKPEEPKSWFKKLAGKTRGILNKPARETANAAP